MLLILLASCSEYEINLGKKDLAQGNGGYAAGDNQLLGYPPEDACDLLEPSETSLPIIEGCEHEPVVGLLDATVEWEIELYPTYSEYGETVMAPVIGQLSDDNGDGRISWEDTPDIVIITDDGGLISNKHGVIRILSGADGSEIKSVNRADYNQTQVYAYRYANVALGDVDSDGLPDIVTLAEVVGGSPPEEPVEPAQEPGDTGVPVPLPSTPPEPSSGENPCDEPSGEASEEPDNPILPPPPPNTTDTSSNNNNNPGGGGGGGDTSCEPSSAPSQPASSDTSEPEPSEPGSGGGQPAQEPSSPPEEGPASPQGCRMVAYDHELNIKWLSEAFTEDCGGHAPALADLEGDGEVEVIVGHFIFRGMTGDLRAQGEGDEGRFKAYAEMGMSSIVTDLDVDGVQEIIAGRTVYGPTGNIICQGEGPMDGFTAAADLDLDGLGEFVVVGNEKAIVYDTDCSILSEWPLQGGGTGGPPTIADYDGDLMPEIGLVDAQTYSVYQPNGIVEWSTPVTDESSHATGSLVFDFEGDGFPEVVYADELALWVFDGRNGQVRLRDEGHNSRTLHEYPTVADIDNDGSIEMVVVNGGSHYDGNSRGIFTIGSATNSWQRGRQVWNQHAYSITNINEDLSIPERPRSNWPEYNNFRSGDVNPIAGSSAADAVPLAEPCLLECYLDRIDLVVRVGNQGPAPMRSGLVIRVSTKGANGSDVFLAEQLTEELISPGGASEEYRFVIHPEAIKNETLIVTVDEGDFVSECSEGNNRIELQNISCDNAYEPALSPSP